MLFFAFCSSVISKPSLKPVSSFLAVCYVFPHLQNKQKNPPKNPNFSFLIFFPASVFLPLVHGSVSSASSPLGKAGPALLGGHKLQQKMSLDSLAVGSACRKGILCLCFEKDFSRLLPHSSSAVCPSGFCYEM